MLLDSETVSDSKMKMFESETNEHQKHLQYSYKTQNNVFSSEEFCDVVLSSEISL